MKEEIAKLLSDKSLSAADVRRLEAAYPYFTPPMAEYLRSAAPTDSTLSARIATRLALSMATRADTLESIGPDSHRFDDFYPQDSASQKPDTASAIDTFIDQFGPADKHELDVMSRVIFSSTPSYAATIGAEAAKAEANNPDTTPARKEQEIPADKTPEKPAEETREEPSETSPKLMQSLAMVMVRQRNYTKALEIISQLNLKYPEKSFIFAHQISFIHKLIEIENKKKNKPTDN